VFRETSTDILFNEVTFHVVCAEANLSACMTTQESGIHHCMREDAFNILYMPVAKVYTAAGS
jgi:hypothetical protein